MKTGISIHIAGLLLLSFWAGLLPAQGSTPPVQGVTLQLVATHRTPGVTAIAFAPDGKTWAAACDLETLVFGQSASPRSIRMWQREPELKFSADGNRLSGDGHWADVESAQMGDVTMSRNFQMWQFRNVVYSSTGDTAIFYGTEFHSKCCPDRHADRPGSESSAGKPETPYHRVLPTLEVVDNYTARTIHKLSGPYHDHERYPMAIDGKWLAAFDYDSLHIWDWQQGAVVATRKAPTTDYRYLAFVNEGRQLVSVSHRDGHVVVWETQTWNKQWSGTFPLDAVTRIVSGGPYHKSLVLVGTEKDARIWKITPEGRPVQYGPTLPGKVNDLAFAHEGKELWVAGGNSTKVYRLNR